MKTIRQVAEEVGVSKQAVSKRLAQLPPTEVTTNERGVKLITPYGEELLKGIISPTKPQLPPTLPPTADKHVDDLIAMLQRELDTKNKQIEAQQQTISELTTAMEHTTASLHAAQALHAGTMQRQLTESGEPVVIDTATPGRWARLLRAWKGE